MREIGVNRTLGEIASIEMGQSPNGNSYNTLGKGVPLINGPTEFTNRYPVPRQWTTEPTKVCKNGDLLLCVRGSVGRINIADNEFCIGRGVASIRANVKDIHQLFLIELVKYEVEKITRLSSGSTFPNVNKATLTSCKVRVPSLPEQRKIAAILRTWDDAIEKIDLLIKKRQQEKSILQIKIFSGMLIPKNHRIKSVRLYDIAVSIIDGDRGKNYPKSDDFSSNADCLFLSAKNVTNDGFKFDEPQFISAKKDRLMSKGKLRRNDIVLTTRGTVGNIAWFNDTVPYHSIRINSGMVIIRNESLELDTEFLYKTLSSEIVKNQIKRTVFGSAQPQLTLDLIRNFKIPLPPVKKQQKIAAILRFYDESFEKLDKYKRTLNSQKRGLMQKLLTGQWRVNFD